MRGFAALGKAFLLHSKRPCGGMADTPVLEAGAERRESSSLSRVTYKIITEAVKMGYFNLTFTLTTKIPSLIFSVITVL